MNAETGLILTCEEVQDALGAYALGAIDGDEAGSIDAHLVDCPICREALAENVRTVEALAIATAPRIAPSPDVRVRLLEHCRAAGQAPRINPAISVVPASSGRSARGWLLPVLAAAATLLLVGVGVLSVLLTRVIDERDEAIDAAQLLSTYVSAGGEVVTLLSQPAPAYQGYQWQGSLLTAPGKNPVVVVAGCPKSGKHMTYWVWFAREGERTPAGKLTVGANGSGYMTLNTDQPLSKFDAIGITVVLENEDRQDVLVAPLHATFEG